MVRVFDGVTTYLRNSIGDGFLGVAWGGIVNSWLDDVDFGRCDVEVDRLTQTDSSGPLVVLNNWLVGLKDELDEDDDLKSARLKVNLFDCGQLHCIRVELAVGLEICLERKEDAENEKM